MSEKQPQHSIGCICAIDAEQLAWLKDAIAKKTKRLWLLKKDIAKWEEKKKEMDDEYYDTEGQIDGFMDELEEEVYVLIMVKEHLKAIDSFLGFQDIKRDSLVRIKGLIEEMIAKKQEEYKEEDEKRKRLREEKREREKYIKSRKGILFKLELEIAEAQRMLEKRASPPLVFLEFCEVETFPISADQYEFWEWKERRSQLQLVYAEYICENGCTQPRLTTNGFDGLTEKRQLIKVPKCAPEVTRPHLVFCDKCSELMRFVGIFETAF